jgi:tRNA-2-methylthio-N6-dimethylallyladenosine synthase
MGDERPECLKLRSNQQLQKKSVYLETFGCQMNVLDSELVLGQLSVMGYEPTEDVRQPICVLFNTCSVRQHAEDKVYSRLGQVAKIKHRRPGMIVGVIGCMAERDHDGIQTKAPHVDLLCGPGNLNEVSQPAEEVLEGRSEAPNAQSGRATRDAGTRAKGRNRAGHRPGERPLAANTGSRTHPPV